MIQIEDYADFDTYLFDLGTLNGELVNQVAGDIVGLAALPPGHCTRLWARLQDLGVTVSVIKDLKADVKRASAAKTNAAVLPTPVNATEVSGHAWMALTLEPEFAGRYKHLWERPGWYEYSLGRWKVCDPNIVVTNAMTFLHNTLADQLKGVTDKRTVEQILEKIQMVNNRRQAIQGVDTLAGMPGFSELMENLDAHPWLLNVQNGTLDLKTMTLLPHTPDHLLTKLCGVDFEPDAQAPLWKEHVEYLLPDPEIRRQVQRDLGLAIVGEQLEEFFSLWIGMGKNGKSTTANVLMKVLGDYCVQAAPNLFVRKLFAEHPTGIADLVGARLVFASELESGMELNEQLIKNLTGGDLPKARFMRGDFFAMKASFTIVLYANNRPVINGTDDGIWRRPRLIDWGVQVSADRLRPQPDVVDELMVEGPGILNWLLDGLRDWQADHNWRSEKVTAAIVAYRGEQDVLVEFLDATCTRKSNATVTVSELYNAYVDYAIANKDKPLGKQRFNLQIEHKGFVKDKKDNANIWWGLSLNASPSAGEMRFPGA